MTLRHPNQYSNPHAIGSNPILARQKLPAWFGASLHLTFWPIVCSWQSCSCIFITDCHQPISYLSLQIQSTIVPEVVLKEWAQRTYRGAADYWTFRKQVSPMNKLTSHINGVFPNISLQYLMLKSRALFHKWNYFASVCLLYLFLIFSVYNSVDATAICRIYTSFVKTFSRDAADHSWKWKTKRRLLQVWNRR